MIVTMDPVHHFIVQYTYVGIFISLGLGIIGLPVPDETILAFVGFLIFKGNLHVVPAFLSSFSGTIFGITTSYFMGRFLGRSVIDRYSSKLHLSKAHISKARQWYECYGKITLMIGYFIPGVRHVSAILSGVSLTPYRAFSLYAYSGGFLWCLTFIIFGYVVGEEWDTVLHFAQRHVLPIVIVGTLVVMTGLILLKKRK